MPFISSVRGSYGAQGRFARTAAQVITTPNSYPTANGNYQLFTTPWDANDTNLLSASHSGTTFTVPQNIASVRVLVWGSGAQHYTGRSGTPGDGGFIDAIIPVTPGDKYKVIVAGNGSAFTSQSGGLGGYGIGGGAAQDGNDIGSGGAGSGFFYAFNSSNTIVSTEAQMFAKGCLVAGGGGTLSGHGMTGTQSNITFSGISGVGRDGGRGNNNGGGGGRASGQGGDSYTNASNTLNRSGGADGFGGQYGSDAYSASYGNGSGGGRGAGGGASGQGSGGSNGENSTGTGGRGGLPSGLNSSGFGRGGSGAGGGGNGSVFNGIKLGGGGGGSHGSPAGAGGWSGGGGSYYEDPTGGGGGSGAAFGSIITPTLSGWVNPNSVTINGGNPNSVFGLATTTGKGSSVNGTGYSGAVVIMW